MARKRKRKQRTRDTITRAVTHIRLLSLEAANESKRQQLDELGGEYQRVCQAYVTLFCTTQEPDPEYSFEIETRLSGRWHRDAIRQAAGVAQGWRSNRERELNDYQEQVGFWEKHPERHLPQVFPAGCKFEISFKSGRTKVTYPDGRSVTYHRRPEWNEPHTPVLKEMVITASVNVVKLEASESSSFDAWVKVSTLDKGHPVCLPVNFAGYHQQVVQDQTLNGSVVLLRRQDGWWLQVSYDETPPPQTDAASPVVGVDVGITHFVTASTGKQYGQFSAKLLARHQREQEKRRRKAKLRACLEKRGVTRLPSTTNSRLARHTRQAINRAVNQFYTDHPGCQIAHETLNRAGMRFKSRRMNAYLSASQLGWIPKQLVWGAKKRGVAIHSVQAAYTSQACPECHFVSRSNRPQHQTFCCQVCRLTDQADRVAARNIQSRHGDADIHRCRTIDDIKAVLQQRHQAYCNRVGRSPTARQDTDPSVTLAKVNAKNYS